MSTHSLSADLRTRALICNMQAQDGVPNLILLQNQSEEKRTHLTDLYNRARGAS